MPGRNRSTKKLAQRIDLDYFKRLYSIPRWRRLLSIVLTGVGLLWLGWQGLRAYNAGPLAHSHAILTNNCASCHASQSAFGKKVTDTACLACHDGPVHHVEQTFTPECTECHVEHQGSFRLRSTRDESCTQCHRNLKNQSKFAAKITSFDSGHPDFAALGSSDPGTIKFGHQVHLKKDLRGPHGLVQLQCADCHTRAGAALLPVDYQKHCADCHGLQFDQRFAEPAPHRKPEIVVAYVTQKFTTYIAAHPEEVHMADPADPRILRPPLPPARNAGEWISRRVADSETLLWRKSCKECHTLKIDGALPEVPAAAIQSRWFGHASFDHEAHQMTGCIECHKNALTSRETSDVLIPGIATCRSCHRSGADAADSRCSECHTYHDWSKEKPIDGRFTIKSFSQD